MHSLMQLKTFPGVFSEADQLLNEQPRPTGLLQRNTGVLQGPGLKSQFILVSQAFPTLNLPESLLYPG